MMVPMKPADATWTDEQWQAIYLDGTNIIVSAGAGSGKTAVLTERIIEKLKSGVDIDQLVVLTFTNAAAFEMKNRVRDKIKKEIAKGNSALKGQLDKIDQAIITTFDSFSLSLVKQYHYLLGIPKEIGIIDSVLLETKKREFMDQIFQKFYEEEDATFLKYIDTFTTKDDQKLQLSLLKLSSSLDALYDKENYLCTYMERYYEKSFIDSKKQAYLKLLENSRIRIFSLVEQMEEVATQDACFAFLEKLKGALMPLWEAHTYEAYLQFRASYSSVLLPRSKKIDPLELEKLKEIYEEVKGELKKLFGLCKYQAEELEEQIWKTKENAGLIIQILKRYEERLFAYKTSIHEYEFHDISRMAISLLEQHQEIKDSLKHNIHEIMIDEYQDTNDIGDYFISLISNHNVYMVGDIKQSIYRFRNANPSIFMEKYNAYQLHQGGEKIDLNKNFRSRKEVLSNINTIFERIMDLEVGGADYEHGHAMVFGNMVYETKGSTNQDYNMEFLNYAYKETEFAKKFKQNEIEAFIIACDIKKKVENHYQIFDKEEKKLRDATYKDFAILLDRKTSFDLYKKIFTYLEVPLTIHKDEEFVYSNEIFVVRNILRAILGLRDSEYMVHFPYVFYSIARSFLVSYTDNEIFLLYQDQEHLLEQIAQESSIFYPLYQKLIFLKEYSYQHTIEELLERVFEEFSIYQKLITLGEVEFTKLKLEYLIDVARNLSKKGYQLKEFVGYFDDAFRGKLDLTFSLGADTSNNSVNMMTIHKSKGLEYPICYFAGLNKDFSRDDLKEKYIYHKDLGILLPCFDEGICETFYKELLKQDYIQEDVSERLRVFYVALTRAKEKLIFVGNFYDSKKEPSRKDKVTVQERYLYKNFYDVIVSIRRTLEPYFKEVLLEELPITKNYEIPKQITYQRDSYQEKEFSIVEIQEEAKEVVEEKFSSEVIALSDKKEQLMQFGTRFHECLEYLDFDTLDGIDEMDAFMAKKIKALLQQPFMQNLINPIYHKEYEFFDRESHGIIDFMIETEDRILVIDYKLKTIDKACYQKQVKGYIHYLKSKTDKIVQGYLYSILDETYIEVRAL